MRLLLLSDIHANLEALEACLAAAPAYDRMVNLGDMVGYNASPNEVCERVRAMNSPVVRGNHDRACSGLSEPIGIQHGGCHVGTLDAGYARSGEPELAAQSAAGPLAV